MNDLSGVWTAIITPFDGQEIDYSSFEKLLENQKKAGITGVVIAGSTGEGPNITLEEKVKLVTSAKKVLADSVQVMVSVGSSSTKISVEHAKAVLKAGADSLLVATPAYNKPTLPGLIKHFEAIAEQGAPICLYHIPGRTAQRLSFESLKILLDIKNVVAIKEATADLNLFSQLCQLGKTVLSGDDPTFLASLSVGGNGVVSVVTNVFPSSLISLYKEFKTGNIEKAKSINNKYFDYIDLMGLETNPGPVKAAVSILGLCKNQLRLPLVELEKNNHEILSNATLALKESLN